jgi:hypothetical protein
MEYTLLFQLTYALQYQSTEILVFKVYNMNESFYNPLKFLIQGLEYERNLTSYKSIKRLELHLDSIYSVFYRHS